MANEQNLRPGEYKLSVEEAKKGGIASGEARRRKKAMKEKIELLLSLPVKNEKAKLKMKALGIDEEEQDNEMAMIVSMLNVALQGGKTAVGAASFLRDTIGEKPTDKVEHSGSIPVVIEDDITE